MTHAHSTGTPRVLRGAPFPRLVSRAASLYSYAHALRWSHAQKHVEDEQRAVLRSLVARGEGTQYGTKIGLAKVRSYHDFVSRVAIGDYDSHSPYIERMRDGESNVLVPERIHYFGNSSGSSNHGKPKFLPISDLQVTHQQKSGTDILMRYLATSGDRGFFEGFTLGLSPPTTMKRDRESWVTSNPALMATRIPKVAQAAYLPDEDIKQIADYDVKLQRIAERYLDWDIRAVTGTTCWFSVLFAKVLAVARSRGRSARCVREIWPNLRVLLGGGVSADPYVPIIEEQMGGPVTLVDTYNATEGGIYAASDHSGLRGMAMLPHRGTFFEFVEVSDARRTRVPLWAVEKDVPYSIVVTTSSGLFAYELGDIVRFTSVSPPRIEFMGRLSGCLSVTQELTTHVEIERAVAHALEKVPCRTVDFGVGGEVGVKSRYVVYAEFDRAPSDLGALARAFDEGMQAENRVYREHRKDDVAILAPVVVPLRTGGARAFLDESTRGNVQGKFPRILDEQKTTLIRKYVEEKP